MVAWPTCCRGVRKPQRRQIKFVDEHIDDADGTVLGDVIVHARRQEKLLPAVPSLDKTTYPTSPDDVDKHSISGRFHTASTTYCRSEWRCLVDSGPMTFDQKSLEDERPLCYRSDMLQTHKAAATTIKITFSLMIALGVPSAAQQNRSTPRVQLVEPFEHASAPDTSSILGYKFAGLAKIDPAHPLDDEMASQTLSLFGREDLIAGSSSNYKSINCAPLTTPADVMGEIKDRARKTSIVIINESHERSEHRGFIADVARQLRPLGYDTLAIETLSNPPPGTPERYMPLFLTQPGLPYFVDEDGFYLSEPGFGRLGRLVKALGYRLLPYEPNEDAPTRPPTPDEQIALREEGQARNLAAFMRLIPGRSC